MSGSGCAIFLVILAQTWVEPGAASSGRSGKYQKLSLAASALHPASLPVENGLKGDRLATKCLNKLDSREYTLAFPPVMDFFESYRGQLALDLQLRKVRLYYAVDYTNHPLVSYYPKSGASTHAKPRSASYKVKRPNYYTLVRDFMALFTPDQESKTCTRHTYSQVAQNVPNALVLFMDANSCADHVVDLNKQDREAKMATCRLNRVYRLFERGLNMYRDRETVNVVVPLSQSLVFATNKGGSNFNGTPVFTTDPPVYVSSNSSTAGDKGSTKNGEFDKFHKNNKLLVFFSPEEAKEFYKKVRWNKALRDEKTGKVYRLWSNSPPMRPELRMTSLEKVYTRVHGPEPHWGYLLEFVPPEVKLDTRTAMMLKESASWFLVPFYSAQRLVKRLWNQGRQ